MEIWKEIKDYEGFYEISNTGCIRSVKRIVTYSNGINHLYKSKVLSPSICNGYYKVTLHKNGLKKTHSVHRLVAEAFIDNPKKLPCVNHKDENRLNNNADNLEWCTIKYNSNYGNAQIKKAKKCFKPLCQLDLNGNVIKLWNSMTDVEKELGIKIASISNNIHGHSKSAGGYKWRFN